MKTSSSNTTNFISVTQGNYEEVMAALPEGKYFYEIALTGAGSNLYTLYMRRGNNMPLGDMGCLGYDSGFKGIMGASLESAVANAAIYFNHSTEVNILVYEGINPRAVKPGVVRFGKFSGKTIPEIMGAEGGVGYITWLAGEISKPSKFKNPDWLVAQVAEAMTLIKGGFKASTAAPVVENTPMAIASQLDAGITAADCEVIGSLVFAPVEGVNIPYSYGILPDNGGRNYDELTRKGCYCAMCGKAAREAVYLAQNDKYWDNRGLVCLNCAQGAKKEDSTPFDISLHREIAQKEVQADVNRYGSKFLNRYRGIKP